MLLSVGPRPRVVGNEPTTGIRRSARFGSPDDPKDSESRTSLSQTPIDRRAQWSDSTTPLHIAILQLQGVGHGRAGPGAARRARRVAARSSARESLPPALR